PLRAVLGNVKQRAQQGPHDEAAPDPDQPAEPAAGHPDHDRQRRLHGVPDPVAALTLPALPCRRPAMRLAHAALLAASMLAYRAPATVPPPPQALPPGRPRVAVLPFHPGEQVQPSQLPADVGLELARVLAGKLSAAGVSVVDPEVVFGATELADTGTYGPELGARVARKVGANLAVVGVLTRYRERVGTDWSVEQPASAAYTAVLVRASDGATLDTPAVGYTQQALRSHPLPLPRVARG